MNELIFVVEEDSTGGYTARALGVSIITEAESRDELSANVREAVEAHFGESNERPSIVRLHFVHDEVFAL